MRFFIAIGLPDSVKTSLMAIQPAAGPGIRRVEVANLHLTLHFLGELSDQQYRQVCQSLARIHQEEFTLRVRGLGTFPERGEPRILWAGIEINPRLQSLHEELGETLREAINYQTENRPYAPHITIARLKEGSRLDSITECLNRNREIHLAATPVTQFGVYSSQVLDGVPHYREEAAFLLRKIASGDHRPEQP